MQYIPAVTVFVGLGVCLCTFVIGMAMSLRMGGSRAMMQPTSAGRWSSPRRLVYGGVIGFILFNCLFTILTWIPGALPWRDATDAHRPAARLSDVARTTEHDAPDFDPRLSLEWPGVPEESRRRITRGSEETMIYSARFSQTGPVTLFGASVYQFSENELQGYDSRQMLAEHGTSSSDEELTRKQIEHGPKKYLGFDVTAKSGTAFVRRVTVRVKNRIYSVEVLSLKPERLNAVDVTKFFESFAVKD